MHPASADVTKLANNLLEQNQMTYDPETEEFCPPKHS